MILFEDWINKGWDEEQVFVIWAGNRVDRKARSTLRAIMAGIFRDHAGVDPVKGMFDTRAENYAIIAPQPQGSVTRRWLAGEFDRQVPMEDYAFDPQEFDLTPDEEFFFQQDSFGDPLYLPASGGEPERWLYARSRNTTHGYDGELDSLEFKVIPGATPMAMAYHSIDQGVTVYVSAGRSAERYSIRPESGDIGAVRRKIVKRVKELIAQTTTEEEAEDLLAKLERI